MDTPLGKPTRYRDRYDPDVLAALERAPSRSGLGVHGPVPFAGEDVWHGYEFSWQGRNGMPAARVLRLRVDAASPCIVESKSLKLYLNGYAQTRFDSTAAVCDRLSRDLGRAFGLPITVELLPPQSVLPIAAPPGHSLDGQDLAMDAYQRSPELLDGAAGGSEAEEAVYTDLFRSLCPVTAQPDWATVWIRYRGAAIDRGALLRYLVSFRRHQAFHETTVEQIFLDLKARCGCERLVVAGYFLRRGGLDINPVRADPEEVLPAPRRLARQ